MVVTAAMSVVASAQAPPPLPSYALRPPAYAKCDHVVLRWPLAPKARGPGTIVAIAGDHVRSVAGVVFVNNQRFAAVCPAGEAVTLPPDAPEVDLKIPLTQYLVTFVVTDSDGKTRREVLLLGAPHILGLAR